MPVNERMTRFVQPLRSGQITIPAEFRRRLGITERTMLRLTLEGRELRIQPVDMSEKAGGAAWFEDLSALFAPVREEAQHHPEAEVDTAIDEAVAAVRQQHARRT